MPIDECEDLDRMFDRAKQAREDTGDRYVPVANPHQSDSTKCWCVVDAQTEVIVSSGHTFTVALDNAAQLSRLDVVAKLEAEGGLR